MKPREITRVGCAAILIPLATGLTVIAVCLMLPATKSIQAGMLQSAGAATIAICVTLTLMVLQSIPALRFYLSRWNDWKYRNDKWLVLYEGKEPGAIAWSIAEYFKFPMVNEARPQTDEKTPAINRFAALPNKIIHVRVEQDGEVVLYIYYPRLRVARAPLTTERMAASRSFDLAHPECFDHIEKWLRTQEYKKVKKCLKR